MRMKRRSPSFLDGIYSSITRRWSKLYPYITKWAPWLVYLGVFFGLASGVVNVMVETARLGRVEAVIIPSRSLQTWAEVVINFLVLVLGSFGIYLMYQGGRRRIGRRTSELYIASGLVFLAIAILIGFSLLAEKGF